MSTSKLTKCTYYTVTPLTEGGLPCFSETFRSSTRKDAYDNRRVFDASYGEHGWSPVVKHTVYYSKKCGQGQHWGKQFKIADYAQRDERYEIAQSMRETVQTHVFVHRNNRYMSLDNYASQVMEIA